MAEKFWQYENEDDYAQSRIKPPQNEPTKFDEAVASLTPKPAPPAWRPQSAPSMTQVPIFNSVSEAMSAVSGGEKAKPNSAPATKVPIFNSVKEALDSSATAPFRQKTETPAQALGITRTPSVTPTIGATQPFRPTTTATSALGQEQAPTRTATWYDLGRGAVNALGVPRELVVSPLAGAIDVGVQALSGKPITSVNAAGKEVPFSQVSGGTLAGTYNALQNKGDTGATMGVIRKVGDFIGSEYSRPLAGRMYGLVTGQLPIVPTYLDIVGDMFNPASALIPASVRPSLSDWIRNPSTATANASKKAETYRGIEDKTSLLWRIPAEIVYNPAMMLSIPVGFGGAGGAGATVAATAKGLLDTTYAINLLSTDWRNVSPQETALQAGMFIGMRYVLPAAFNKIGRTIATYKNSQLAKAMADEAYARQPSAPETNPTLGAVTGETINPYRATYAELQNNFLSMLNARLNESAPTFGEALRGYRSALQRLVKAGRLSEDTANLMSSNFPEYYLMTYGTEEQLIPLRARMNDSAYSAQNSLADARDALNAMREMGVGGQDAAALEVSLVQAERAARNAATPTEAADAARWAYGLYQEAQRLSGGAVRTEVPSASAATSGAALAPVAAPVMAASVKPGVPDTATGVPYIAPNPDLVGSASRAARFVPSPDMPQAPAARGVAMASGGEQAPVTPSQSVLPQGETANPPVSEGASAAEAVAPTTPEQAMPTTAQAGQPAQEEPLPQGRYTVQPVILAGGDKPAGYVLINPSGTIVGKAYAQVSDAIAVRAALRKGAARPSEVLAKKATRIETQRIAARANKDYVLPNATRIQLRHPEWPRYPKAETPPKEMPAQLTAAVNNTPAGVTIDAQMDTATSEGTISLGGSSLNGETITLSEWRGLKTEAQKLARVASTLQKKGLGPKARVDLMKRVVRYIDTAVKRMDTQKSKYATGQVVKTDTGTLAKVTGEAPFGMAAQDTTTEPKLAALVGPAEQQLYHSEQEVLGGAGSNEGIEALKAVGERYRSGTPSLPPVSGASAEMLLPEARPGRIFIEPYSYDYMVSEIRRGDALNHFIQSVNANLTDPETRKKGGFLLYPLMKVVAVLGPNALRSSPIELGLVTYFKFEAVAQAARATMMARVRAAGEFPKMDELWYVTPESGIYALNGKDSMLIYDVVSNPSKYYIPDKYKSYFEFCRKLITEARDWARSRGATVEDTPLSGEFYFPRTVDREAMQKAAGVKGLARRSGRSVGTTQDLEKQRAYATGDEFVKEGGRYVSPYDSMAHYIDGIYRLVNDHDLYNYFMSTGEGRPKPKNIFDELVAMNVPGQPGLTDVYFSAEDAVKVQEALDRQVSKTGRAVAKASSVLRGMVLAGDFSYAMTVGLPILVTSPKTWLYAVGGSLRAFVQPEYLDRFVEQNYPTIYDAVINGVNFGSNDFVERIKSSAAPIKGLSLFGRFESAYNGYGLIGRTLFWRTRADKFRREGHITDFARITNDMTAAFNPTAAGISPRQTTAETILFMVSRYWRAAGSIVLDALRGNGITGLALGSIAGMIGVGVALQLGLGAMLGQDIELRPWKPGFLTVRIGNYRYGFSHPVLQLLKLASTIGLWMTNADGSSRYYTWADNPITRQIRSTSGPFPSMLWDLLSGYDYVGNPTPFNKKSTAQDKVSWVARKLLPLVLQDAINMSADAVLEKKPFDWQAMANIPLEAMGLKIQPTSTSEQRNLIRDEEAMKKYGKKWADIDQVDQYTLRIESPRLRQILIEARNEGVTRGNVDDVFWADVEVQRDTIRKQMGALTQQYLAPGSTLTGNGYRQGLAELEKQMAQLPSILRQSPAYVDVKLSEDDWKRVLGNGYSPSQLPVDRYLSEYYAMSDKAIDPQTGIFNMDTWLTLRENLQKSYPTSVIDKAENFISRDRSIDPVTGESSIGDTVYQELRQAESEYNQYRQIPRFLGNYLGNTQQEREQNERDMNRIVTLRNAVKARGINRREMSGTQADQWIASQNASVLGMEPGRAMKLLQMSRQGQANPARGQFWREHPLLSKYYSEMTADEFAAQ